MRIEPTPRADSGDEARRDAAQPRWAPALAVRLLGGPVSSDPWTNGSEPGDNI
jgi:hypothetical protein